MNNFLKVLLVISCCFAVHVNAQVTATLSTTPLPGATKATGLMCINVGHTSVNGSWPYFFRRLNVSCARRFLNLIPDTLTLQNSFITAPKWGYDLNNVSVTSQTSFLSAIATLRTVNGRNQTYPWTNPVLWSKIWNLFTEIANPLYGSDDTVINTLQALNVSVLTVQHIGCSGSYLWQFMNSAVSGYWGERWEVFKFSYAVAVYTQSKSVFNIEFYNEPDLALGGCLDYLQFLDMYQIRSLSIQFAYYDASVSSYNSLNIYASAFGKACFGGNTTQFLGDICTNNSRGNSFYASSSLPSNWNNMDVYSWHTYGKTGPELYSSYAGLSTVSIPNNALALGISSVPLIITEHNAHTSTSWDTINTTPDFSYEASRLASQIINLLRVNAYAFYIFKFSITPSSAIALPNAIAKNGVHWGECYTDPYDVTDTTLSAESMRLLFVGLKNANLYTVTENDGPPNHTYLGAQDPNSLHYYLYLVNDDSNTIPLTVNLGVLATTGGVVNGPFIVETVSYDYFNEVSNLISYATSFTLTIPVNSTTRITFIPGTVNTVTQQANLACTVYGGNNMAVNSCNQAFMLAGTSPLAAAETTAIAVLRFPLSSLKVYKQRTILTLNIEGILAPLSSTNSSLTATNMTTIIYGVDQCTAWTTSNVNWNYLATQTLLKSLPSGNPINSAGENVANFSSNRLTFVGHVSGWLNYPTTQKHQIDVTDYTNDRINSAQTNLCLLIYRPFRYPSYATTASILAADNLSNGSQMKISSTATTTASYAPFITSYWTT